MNKPLTMEDHCQLLLNLYRGRVPFSHPDWLILAHWAENVLRTAPLSAYDAASHSEKT